MTTPTQPEPHRRRFSDDDETLMILRHKDGSTTYRFPKSWPEEKRAAWIARQEGKEESE